MTTNKSKNILPKTISKILVVQIGRIGDFILAIPLFETLRAKYPNAEIHALVSKSNANVGESCTYIDKVYIHNKGLQLLNTLLALRRENYDLWIDPKSHRSGESQWLARLNNAKFKIGYHEKKSNLFDYQLDEELANPQAHMTYMNMLAFKHLGVQPRIVKPTLTINSNSEKKFKDFQEINKFLKYYCINLSGSQKGRDWTEEKWIDFLKLIEKDTDMLLIIASPEQKPLAVKFVQKLNKSCFYATQYINETYPVIANATLVISPDTSIVHIASAFDTPLLGLYGDKTINYLRFSPMSTLSEVVFRENQEPSMKDIPLERVYSSYLKIREKILKQ